MKRLSASLLLLLALCSHRLMAQDTVAVAGQVAEFQNKWSMGLHLMYGLPLCQLKDGNYRDGLAFDLEVLSPSVLSKEAPLQLKFGGHFDYLFSGREKVEITVTDPPNALANDIIRNSSFGLHLMGRLALKERQVTPYLDGIVGGRFFLSDQIIRLQDYDSDYEPYEANIYTKPTFIFGGSLGALVKMGDGVYADFRVTYSHGSRAKYVDLDSYRKVDDVPVYNTNITRSPLLFVNVGFVFNLSRGDGTGAFGGNGGYERPTRTVERPKRTIQPKPSTPKSVPSPSVPKS